MFVFLFNLLLFFCFVLHCILTFTSILSVCFLQKFIRSFYFLVSKSDRLKLIKIIPVPGNKSRWIFSLFSIKCHYPYLSSCEDVWHLNTTYPIMLGRYYHPLSSYLFIYGTSFESFILRKYFGNIHYLFCYFIIHYLGKNFAPSKRFQSIINPSPTEK